MHLVGEGSFADRRLVRDGKVSLPGKVVTVARHLGSHLGEMASFAHELPRRRQASMTAFYTVGQLWCESRVSWRLKRCFLVGRVVNTALSRIEAFCPSKAQYQSMTSLVTCLARRVMAGAAVRSGEHLRVRTMSNEEVLRFWKLAPCDVEARVRILKWAQTLVQDPAHHTQMITAYGSAFLPVIERVEDHDNFITNGALERQFGPMGAEPVEDVQEKSEQVHVALLTLTESESFDIVLGAAPSGLEALRRLVRRWVALSGGKRRDLLRQI